MRQTDGNAASDAASQVSIARRTPISAEAPISQTVLPAFSIVQAARVQVSTLRPTSRRIREQLLRIKDALFGSRPVSGFGSNFRRG